MYARNERAEKETKKKSEESNLKKIPPTNQKKKTRKKERKSFEVWSSSHRYMHAIFVVIHAIETLGRTLNSERGKKLNDNLFFSPTPLAVLPWYL